ncbi:hypothetical protein CRE_03587 [Caenorhabditis remanei]|uniref:Uncharacterized protein n=1 Tax=Caenorhabditis remanei TaxID=31234 RepID=E3NUY7_CAERE|nr:hypothetical protein CRE_03587 [Caenorhabditis remanei]
MTRLSAEEEIELNHYRFEMPKHSYIFYGFWSTFIIIIVIMTHFNEYSEPVIPWDNCDMNTTWEPPMRSFINDMQLKSELHKIAKFREKNMPFVDGIFEYICAASIIAYNFINAQTNVEMYITPTSEDVKSVVSYPPEVYSPVGCSDKSVIYESLSSVRR